MIKYKTKEPILDRNATFHPEIQSVHSSESKSVKEHSEVSKQSSSNPEETTPESENEEVSVVEAQNTIEDNRDCVECQIQEDDGKNVIILKFYIRI